MIGSVRSKGTALWPRRFERPSFSYATSHPVRTNISICTHYNALQYWNTPSGKMTWTCDGL